MAENIPNSGRGTNIQVQETQRSIQIDTPKHIKIKMVKVKEKEDPKSSKRKTTCYVQGKPHKTSTRFFTTNFSVQFSAMILSFLNAEF